MSIKIPDSPCKECLIKMTCRTDCEAAKLALTKLRECKFPGWVGITIAINVTYTVYILMFVICNYYFGSYLWGIIPFGLCFLVCTFLAGVALKTEEGGWDVSLGILFIGPGVFVAFMIDEMYKRKIRRRKHIIENRL